MHCCILLAFSIWLNLIELRWNGRTFYIIYFCIHSYLAPKIFKFFRPYFYPSFTHPYFSKFYNPFRFLAFSQTFLSHAFILFVPLPPLFSVTRIFFCVFLGRHLTDWFSRLKQDKRAQWHNIKTLWFVRTVAS
jgi:hypothetical protein